MGTDRRTPPTALWWDEARLDRIAARHVPSDQRLFEWFHLPARRIVGNARAQATRRAPT
jgi:hypothetical protein